MFRLYFFFLNESKCSVLCSSFCEGTFFQYICILLVRSKLPVRNFNSEQTLVFHFRD